MAGKKKWRDLRNRTLSPEAQRRVDEGVAMEILEMNLRAIRDLVGKTQAEMAELVGVTQSEISQMERRPDMQLSTLRRYISALGGEIEVRAVIKDKTVKLAV